MCNDKPIDCWLKGNERKPEISWSFELLGLFGTIKTLWKWKLINVKAHSSLSLSWDLFCRLLVLQSNHFSSPTLSGSQQPYPPSIPRNDKLHVLTHSRWSMPIYDLCNIKTLPNLWITPPICDLLVWNSSFKKGLRKCGKNIANLDLMISKMKWE